MSLIATACRALLVLLVTGLVFGQLLAIADAALL